MRASWPAYLWASPVTVLGLLFAVLAWVTRGRVACVRGVIEAHGGLVTWLLERAVPLAGGAEALALGHVILGRSAASFERWREHERVHVRQYERWGVVLLPAYAVASLWMWLRGRDAYRDNPFEREAYRVVRS